MSSFCRPWLHYVPLSTHANEEELMGLLHFLQENQDISRWTPRQKCLMIGISLFSGVLLRLEQTSSPPT